MKRLLACLAVMSSLAASAQFDNAQFPYNPDSEPDGYIGVADVLEVLSIFGSQFDVATLSADSSSALVLIGEQVSYWDCLSSCKALGREWQVMDADAFADHSDSLLQGYDDPIAFAWLKTDHSTTFYTHAVRIAGSQLGRIEAIQNSGNFNQCYCSAQIYPELEYTDVSGWGSSFRNACEARLNEGWRPLGGIEVYTLGTTATKYQAFWRYVPE